MEFLVTCLQVLVLVSLVVMTLGFITTGCRIIEEKRYDRSKDWLQVVQGIGLFIAACVFACLTLGLSVSFFRWLPGMS